jgi:hypothetical protein
MRIPVFGSEYRAHLVGCFGDHFTGLRKGLAYSGEINGVRLIAIRIQPSHRNLLTIEEVHERTICPIDWPPYSQDLNPIQQLSDYMNDWIGDRYLLEVFIRLTA